MLGLLEVLIPPADAVELPVALFDEEVLLPELFV
jgi:hypothetical protein